MKPIIIAIVGESGSGKTILSLHLEKEVGIKAICSYTTRPMRDGEMNGREHWFVDMGHPIPANPLAYTFFGGHHYWTECSQIVDGVSSYVIDEKGLIELKERWSDIYKILAFKIVRPDNDTDETRKQRDAERVTLSDDYYEALILNQGNLQEFLSLATNTIISII